MEGRANIVAVRGELDLAAATVCNAFDTAPFGFVVASEDRRCLAANQTLRGWARFGMPPEGLHDVGLGISDEVFDLAFANALEGEASTIETTRPPLVGGQRGIWLLHVLPFRAPSGNRAVSILFEDITEQHLTIEAFEASERRFRLLVDSAGDGIVVHRNGILLYVNPAAVTMLRYQSAEQLVGRSVHDVVHPDYHAQLEQQIASLGRCEQSCLSREVFVCGDGSQLKVEVRASRAPLDDGLASFVFFRDTTERDELLARLQDVSRMESLSALARSVVGDFDRVLQEVADSVSLAKQRLRDPTAVERALVQAEGALGRASGVVEQLARFSRGTAKPAVPVNPARIAREAVEQFREGRHDHLHLAADLPDDVGRVLVDPGELRASLLALLANACDAAEAGDRIAVSARRVVRPGPEPDAPVKPWVKVSVADSGEGMDAKTRARAFEPFFSTRPAPERAGLGLSAAYGIIKHAGGFIEVKSAQGEGATFDVLLPIDEPSTPVQPEPRQATVLICDDEERLVKLMASLLSPLGFASVQAKSGRELLARVDAGEAFDAILLDVTLPDARAADLLKHLEDRGVSAPVVLTSGYAAEDVPDGLMDQRLVKRYLAKPYPVEDLVDVLHAVLSQRCD